MVTTRDPGTRRRPRYPEEIPVPGGDPWYLEENPGTRKENPGTRHLVSSLIVAAHKTMLRQSELIKH